MSFPRSPVQIPILLWLHLSTWLFNVKEKHQKCHVFDEKLSRPKLLSGFKFESLWNEHEVLHPLWIAIADVIFACELNLWDVNNIKDLLSLYFKRLKVDLQVYLDYHWYLF